MTQVLEQPLAATDEQSLKICAAFKVLESAKHMMGQLKPGKYEFKKLRVTTAIEFALVHQLAGTDRGAGTSLPWNKIIGLLLAELPAQKRADTIYAVLNKIQKGEHDEDMGKLWQEVVDQWRRELRYQCETEPVKGATIVKTVGDIKITTN